MFLIDSIFFGLSILSSVRISVFYLVCLDQLDSMWWLNKFYSPCQFFLYFASYFLFVSFVLPSLFIPHFWSASGWIQNLLWFHFVYYWSVCMVAQLCPTLCDHMGCSEPSSSVHGILQVRILEWVVIPFSRGCSQPREWTCVSCFAGRFFTIWATRKTLLYYY